MVIAKIHNVFKNLTETEQKIASYILEFPEKIVNMTSKELASACGTVPSAVKSLRSIAVTARGIHANAACGRCSARVFVRAQE